MSMVALGDILLVEDNPGDARLVREMVKTRGSKVSTLTHVESMREAESHLAAHDVDMIVLDPGLTDAQGLNAVRRARDAAPHVPLVVLTGLDDESVAMQALKEGAQDYLVKGQIESEGLLRALRHAIERNALENALFVEKERAQVTLNCIGDAVACTDVEGKITFLNAVAEEVTGWPWREAAGRSLAEVFRILDATGHEQLVDPMAIALTTVHDGTVHLPSNSVLVRRDGVEVPIEDSAAPIYEREGRAAGAVIVFRDVSAARATQARLAEVSDELQRSNRELADFAGIASHDLQEPLRKIQAFGDQLAERSGTALDAESSDFLRRMRGAAERMQSLIADLLEYSQVSTEPVDTESVDLHDVIEDVLSDLDERVQATGATIVLGSMPTIQASRLRMRQLFQNLIANAVKFHRDGVAPIVRLSASPVPGSCGPSVKAAAQTTWEFRVADNGVGFDEVDLTCLFQPFQRLRGAQGFPGTGMGLAICRRIVEGHGGAINASSQVGSGTTFVFTLPSVPSRVAPSATASAGQLAS